MQRNKTFNLERQNHTPRKHHQQQQQQQQQQKQPPPSPIPANGQQASHQNEGLTIDLKNFRKPGYGKTGEVFVHKDKGFGFIHLETRTLVATAKVELDNMLLCGKQLHVCFACHSASLTVRNLPLYVSNQLLEEGFSVFCQVERAVVIVDDRGRPSGKDIIEFSRKPAAQKALD